MKHNLMKNFIVERTVRGVEGAEINLLFMVWNDNRTYCFVDLMDNKTYYWYSTVNIEDFTENAVDKLIDNYSLEELYQIEGYITDNSIYDNPENIISKSFLRY